jgi:pyruvate-ferredoxin/flavodoxin oxidoreductase
MRVVPDARRLRTRHDEIAQREPVAHEEYRSREVRFKVVEQTNPSEARRMLEQAQLALDERYKLYEDLAARDGSRFLPHWENA